MEEVFCKKMLQLVSRGRKFYHFRGIILCNAKHLKLIQLKKDRSCTVQQVFYSDTNYFFNLVNLLLPFASYKKVSCCDGYIVIFDGCWIQNLFTKVCWCITDLRLEKNIVRPIFILNIMSMYGYHNEFEFV